MSASDYHSLQDISSGSYNWNVKVRVIRSWRGFSKSGEGFKGLNVLLLDNQNCRMHAFVPGNVIENHEDKLMEGNICSIENFSVKEYKTDEKFRCINSNKQIIFTGYTEVKMFNEDDPLIAKNMFDFYDLSDLSEIANDNIYLTDIIGVIEKDLPKAHILNRFKQTQTQIKMTIVDGSTSASVTFWDSLAEEFENAMEKVTEYPVIIIIASAKISSWQGTNHNTPQIEISNVTATKFYLNYNHHDKPPYLFWLFSPLESAKYYSVKLEIKRANVEENSTTYVASGIFLNGENSQNMELDDTTNRDHMQESMTQPSGSTYHLDDFSDLNFKSPEVNMEKKKKRNLTKKYK